MKKSVKRILTIVLSVMIIMTYMVPGSVFADTALDSDESLTAEVHERDHAIEELSEGADDSDVVISDDEDPHVETEGEIIEEVPEAIEAEEPAEEVTEKPAEELPAAEETVAINDIAKAAAPALKAAGGLSVLAFTSDTHNKSGNVAANRLGTWIEKVKAEYGKVDVMAFGGDMANASASESDFWTLTQADLDQLSQRDVTAVVTTGNHEYSPGNYSNGKNNTTKVYIENSEGIEGSNYRIYCLGSSAYTESSGGGSWWGGGGWNEYTSSQITKLGNYLGSVDSSKVIVVITHYPLHYTSSRTITGAGDVIDALNTAANSGKKIVYLWGHNHTDAPRTETNYDKVFKPGDTITYSSGQSKEINFYYGAAGCMSDSEYGTGSGSVKGKGLVLQINSENKLTFTYYNADLEDVTEGGAFTEADPVAVTGVTVTPSIAEVLERKTVQLTAAVQPADATNKGVTWSSSDAGVATVDSKGLVKGVSEGTVTITATTADGNYTASSTVTVKHNENTSIEETVDITPASSNSPEENISINVGDTLKVNVTNGSSSNTYTFTATLSKNGVAQNLGESSVSIAAGATGTFTFEGVADGTVDITIQNNGSYSNRKGTIHLTVGEGGTTPVDPPTGDSVNITPTTDNPEESIKINVGDTLTINTTNGSSYSGYNYTITTADSSIAQIQGNATIDIAAGATGQFTVKGLAEGTVDIVIQNDQSSAQYVRKGTIHLTVGEGGSTPVDPSVGDTVTYQQANALQADKEYIIVSGNSGSVYVLSTDANGSRILKGIAATVSDGLITLSAADAAKAVFTAEGRGTAGDSVSVWLKNNGQYLYTDSNSGLRMVAGSTQTGSSNSNKVWHYKADDKNLLWFFNSNSADGYTDTSSTYKYYLEVSNGNFTDNHVDSTSLANTTTPKIYLFEKYEGPLEVTDVSLDKTTLTLKEGQTGTLTATVVPSGATNKEVTWSSSNTSVATVDSNGKVTAVAAGTATITVTTVENNKTATCTVTVKSKDDTQTGYVIVIDGFALSSDRSPNEAQGGSSSYTYTGLAGVAYSADDEPADNILWQIEETAGGYYIMTEDGRYLNATYTSGNNSGQGNLKVDNTPDVWSIEGTLEEWMIDGKMLRSTNATNSTPDRPKFLGYEDSANLFTVRSEENADESTLIDPSVTIEERFVETTTLEDGKEYIIAVTKDSGSVYAIKNITGTDTGNTGSTTLTVTPASGSDPAYIETDDADVVWKYQSSNQYMLASTGSNHYLGYESSTYKPRTSSQGRAIIYSGGKLQITSGHYLTCDGGTFGTSTSSSSGATVRLFVKTIEIITHEHVYGEPTWSWTGKVNTRAAVSATATFTCTECGEQVVINADVASATDPSGHVVYTATVTGPDGKTYTDTKNAAEDGKYTVTITADKTEVTPGDEVTFTITLGPVDKFGSFQMTTVIPEGLTYVAGSFTPTGGNEALRKALGFDDVDWTEETMRFTGFTLDEDYVSTEDTVLATFKCTVDSGFTTSATVDMTRLEFYSSTDWTHNMTDQYEIIPATVVYTAHTHNLTSHAAVAATCEAAGNSAYWSCDGCGKFFSDAEGKTEIAENSWVIPALGHNMTAHAAVAATCEAAGNSAYWSCDRCGKFFSDAEGKTEIEQNSWVIPALGHNLTAHAAVAATCEAAGNSAYWSCDGCGKFFSDAEGKTEIAENSWVIPALGHNMTAHAAVAATCETAGNSAYWSCDRCGKFFSDAEGKTEIEQNSWVIPALGHNLTAHAAVTATCEAAGNSAYWSCDRCGKFFSDAEGKTEIAENSWIIPAKGHTLAAHAAVAATCETAGNSAYWSCSECGKFFSDAEGKTKIAENSWIIPATGHDWNEPTWTWTGDVDAGFTAAKATFVCKNDDKHKREVEDTAIEKTTVDPTPSVGGKITYTAEVTGPDGKTYSDKKEKVLPPAGYTYDDPVYTWTETTDGYTCTALMACKEDPTKNITDTATVTYAVTTPATCEAAGTGTYTAIFTNTAFETKTKEVAIPATGHDWNDPTYEWSADHTSVTATFVCKNDGTHTQTATASGDAITSKITKEPTTTAHGEKTYTASITFDGKTYAATATEEIPKLENKEVIRIFGSTRYETSLNVAEELKERLGVEKFDAVIVTNGGFYPDALSGSYLSCTLKAPVLLMDTSKERISAVQDYIKKNLKEGGMVYLLGGTGVVPDSVITGLDGFEHERLGGATRYETNIEIIKATAALKGEDISELIVCSGNGFADSLSAAASGKPIMILNTTLLDSQKDFLKTLKGNGLKITVVGGSGVISDALVGSLAAYGTIEERVWGQTRYETSAKVAEKYFNKTDAGIVACGINFPDGLCGGVLANTIGGPMVLAAAGSTSYAEDYADKSGMSSGIVLGGPTLITDAAARGIYNLPDNYKIEKKEY